LGHFGIYDHTIYNIYIPTGKCQLGEIRTPRKSEERRRVLFESIKTITNNIGHGGGGSG